MLASSRITMALSYLTSNLDISKNIYTYKYVKHISCKFSVWYTYTLIRLQKLQNRERIVRDYFCIGFTQDDVLFHILRIVNKIMIYATKWFFANETWFKLENTRNTRFNMKAKTEFMTSSSVYKNKLVCSNCTECFSYKW